MDLYTHLVRQETQKGQQFLPIGSDGGYHAIFAFEVFRRPFTEFRGRAWNLMMASHLIEAWDRQIHFIESIHLPGMNLGHDPVFELRFIAHPERNQVDLFFLGKTFAPTSDQALSKALDLSREVYSLFPFDFVLRPLADQVEFERAYRVEWITSLQHTEQIVEIRRFERMVATPDYGNGANFLYLTYGWQWHLQGMDQAWNALTKYRQPLMFSVNLSPFLWNPIDYAYFNELEAVNDREAIPGVSASEIVSALKLYRQLLYQTPRPFLMRMTLVGEPAVPRGLANAIGVGLCSSPLQAEPNEVTVGANYTLTWPTCAKDFSVAKFNLMHISQSDWGVNLVDFPIRRLRYAVNAKQAQASFRIPIPPEAGFPDISIGQEVK